MNDPGRSSYFQGGYRGYGKYQWNIKYYGFENELEQGDSLRWGFGEWVKLGAGGREYGFELLTELLGRPIKSGTDGRSGGWLVIDTELTETELALVSEHVKSVMAGLDEFLKEERDYRRSEEEEATKSAAALEKKLRGNRSIRAALKALEKVAGSDLTLVVKGIRLK
jgi:hypothetical protein